MKKFAFLILGISMMTSAQINRFFYEYKFVPNIQEKDNVKTEMMALDIEDKGSNYFSYKAFQADSIMNADLQKQLATVSNGGSIQMKKNIIKGDVAYSVQKTYNEDKVYLIQSLAGSKYKVQEEEKLNWKIQKDKQKIGDYQTQLATTDFGGRTWKAWFAKDLPFTDGPYKFYGLPGLIVKMEDSTGSHVMTLLGNKKLLKADVKKEAPISGPSGRTIVMMGGSGGKEISVTEKQFQKVWEDYLNDPAKELRNMLSMGEPGQKVVIKMRDASGREMSDMNEIVKSMEKRTREEVARDNNKIEPSLYPDTSRSNKKKK